MQAQDNSEENNLYGTCFIVIFAVFVFFFIFVLLKCVYLDAYSYLGLHTVVSVLQRGLELGQKKHWSMKLTTIPP